MYVDPFPSNSLTASQVSTAILLVALRTILARSLAFGMGRDNASHQIRSAFVHARPAAFTAAVSAAVSAKRPCPRPMVYLPWSAEESSEEDKAIFQAERSPPVPSNEICGEKQQNGRAQIFENLNPGLMDHPRIIQVGPYVQQH
ncbi:hypothetical protein B0H14DRAFT_2577781 [Mycena olivaceomarginata]|nr:hypothetical protein B0H14DRAFT_2577781 [Mycena olivaceomarginata]